MSEASPPVPVPPLPALEDVLARPRAAALDAFARAGWRPYATPLGLDAARRRVLNLDLGDPDVAFGAGGAPTAVARIEADRAGAVVNVEVVAAEPADAGEVAARLLAAPGAPREGGGPEAREWVWGPESGLSAVVGGEPVRLWMCAERAYGDRLWLVASLVRRG